MPENNDIVDVLRSIDGGRFLGAAADKLDRLVTQMAESARNAGGKPKGKLNLSISLKLDGGIMEITGDVKMTEPATIHGRAIRFVNGDGVLVREDPRQTTLSLTAPVRDATPDFRRASGGDRD